MSRRIIYSRGFPYGAPLAIIRGGATKEQEVKDFIKAQGFRWNDSVRYAWSSYQDRQDFGQVLKTLRDEYGCTIVPKDGMDMNYRIDLDDPDFSRPKEDWLDKLLSDDSDPSEVGIAKGKESA